MKINLLIGFILVLTGCKDNKTTIPKVILEDHETANDTWVLEKEKPIIIYDMDFSDWKIDEIDLSLYEFLKRDKDTLKIVAKDTTILMVNEHFDEDKENYGASNFSVAHVYLDQSVVELQAIAFEYSYHVLADLKTGDTIFSYGQPMFSKDGEYIFTSNVDLDVAFDDNGYQLIKRDSLGFTTVKTVDIEDWGIQKASWISNDSIAYSKVTMNENYESSFEDRKMKIK